MSTVALGPSYRAARVLARVHGCPIGYADIADPGTETIGRDQVVSALDADAVARAIQHLNDDLMAAGILAASLQPSLPSLLAQAAQAQLTCQHSSSAGGPLVSIAICTRDRHQSIGATLASLSRQTYRNVEILVIDNAPSSDATEALVRAEYPHMRYIREQRRGLNHARNRAIAEAAGSIVAYIDDDAAADPGWVQALVAAFDTPDVMCVTGLVAPAHLDTPGQELFERYGYSKSFHRLSFSLAAPPPASPGFPYKGYLGTGCNCAFRRSVFDQVGLFDPRLDMGTPVPGGGDHDMFARIIRAGHTLVYDPNPVVFHDHIADLRIVVARLGQYQESFIAFMTKSILSDREYAWPLLAHVLFWYARRTTRGLAAAITKRDRPFMLVVSEAIGAWRGPISLYRAHRLVQAAERPLHPEVLATPVVAPPESIHES